MLRVSQVALVERTLPAMWETRVRSLGQEDPLEEGMAIHSSILTWRIPWTEEPGRLQSMGSQRVGQDCSSKLMLRVKLPVNLRNVSIPCYSVTGLSSQIFRILLFLGPAYMLTLPPKSFSSLTNRGNASSTLVLKLWLLPQTFFCLCVCCCFTC